MLVASALVALAVAAPAEPRLLFRAGAVAPTAGGGRLAGPLAELTPGPAARLAVAFAASPGPRERALLEAAGAVVHAYLPEHAFLVTASAAARARLAADPAVRAVWPLAPAVKLAPELAVPSATRIRVLLFPDAALEQTLAALGAALPQAAISIVARSPRGAIVALDSHDGSPFALAELARVVALDDVLAVEPASEPRPLNDDTIWVGQSYDTLNRRDYDLSATIWNQGLTGSGQIVGVLDTGLDSDMCYFKLAAAGATEAEPLAPPARGLVSPGRKVIAFYVKPGADADAISVHGTSVAAVVAGDDFATLATPSSGGHDTGDGMAPGARIVMQVPLSIGDDVYAAFAQSYASGARIHNNSWGSALNIYDSQTREVDAFAWEHEGFLPVFAGGNAGGSRDDASVLAPNLGKNTLAVGATTAGSDALADDLTDFSSRGPCFDGRRKPDLVAPGNGIVSAFSDADPTSDNCATVGPLGGTSYASPAAAGFAALARQYFTDGFYPSRARNAADGLIPSAALLKAVLVNGADPLRGRDRADGAPVDPIPSFNQGWGRVRLDTALPFAGSRRSLRAIDRPNAAGLETGEFDRFELSVGAGEPLRATLVWADPPALTISARSIVNDLDLELRAPDGSLYRGNVFAAGSSVPGGPADDLNNVESVLVASPLAGTWEVAVRARAVPGNGAPLSFRQGYGLVASWQSCPPSASLPATPGLADIGAAGVRVTFALPVGASGVELLRAEGGCGAATGAFGSVGLASASPFDDASVESGRSYGYRLRGLDGCGASSLGPCAAIAPAGRCLEPPAFAGLVSAASEGTTCAVTLGWARGGPRCPGHSRVRYNVYRSPTPDFEASPATLIAAGLDATAFIDAVPPGRASFYYTVRSEDLDAEGSGPAGGLEDANRVVLATRPAGAAAGSGVLVDDAGDSLSLFAAAPSAWSFSPLENVTPGGRLSYRSSRRDFWTYESSACSALTAGPFALAPGGLPELSYSVRYNLEHRWDGVVVELSDAGGAWVDLPPSGGYPSSFELTEPFPDFVPINACGYPATQGAFSGPAGNEALTAWVSYRSDLTPWAGRSVSLRFRLSSDGSASADGLFLDDVRLSDVALPGACEACAIPASVGGSLRAVKADATTPGLFWSDVAGAFGYRIQVSLRRDFASIERSLDATSGAVGTPDPGALSAPPALLFYRIRAISDCGALGP